MDANETFNSQTLSIMSAVFEDVVREIGLAVEVHFKDAPSCQVSKFQSELSTALHPMMTEAVRKVCQLFQSLGPHRDAEVEMSPLDFPASQSNNSETEKTEQAQTGSQTASIEYEIVNFKPEPLDGECKAPEFGLLSEAASQERKKIVQGQAKACERKQRPDKRPQRKRKSPLKTIAAQRSREGDETNKSSPGCVDEPHFDTPDIGQSETLQADSGEQCTPTTETLNGNSPCSCPSSPILTHAKEKPFACDECGAPFAAATALERHTAVVHKASLTCATCGKAFHTPSLLKVHLRLHTGERPYKCSQCPKAFRMQSCLTKHRVVHTGKKSYACKACGACFSSKGNLNRHDLTHTGVRPYVCDKCGKRYTQPSTLKIHMASHDMNMPAKFLCELCGKSFPFNHVLNTHKRLMHVPTAVTSGGDDNHCEVTCEVCSITFRSVWLLAAHEQVHSGDRRHRCVKCKKDFFHQSSLDDHMRVHVQKKYVCSVCGRAYMNKYTLTYHMKVHVEGKSCLCFMCGKRFLTKHALEIHQRSHTGEKPYKCDTCGKRFSNNGNLSRHKLVHTGERPYSCDVCGKRFNQQVAVELHMQVHTGIRPYYCNKCGRGFSDSRHYKKHTCDQKTLEVNRPKKGY